MRNLPVRKRSLDKQAPKAVQLQAGASVSFLDAAGTRVCAVGDVAVQWTETGLQASLQLAVRQAPLPEPALQTVHAVASSRGSTLDDSIPQQFCHRVQLLHMLRHDLRHDDDGNAKQ